jgi:hypothetical protein
MNGHSVDAAWPVAAPGVVPRDHYYPTNEGSDDGAA